MRIILASDFFWPTLGGVASHMEDLGRFLITNGHQVFVLSKKTKKEEKSFPFQVIRVNCFGGPSAIKIPKLDELERAIKKIKPDIIHSHHCFTPLSLYSISLAKKFKIPSILTNHSIQFLYDIEYLWKPLSYALFPYRKYINLADRIIAVSTSAAEFISHFTDKKVIVIPNAIWTDDFYPKQRKFDGRTILFTGRITYRKGVHILIEAMPQILKEKKDAQLIIIGQGYFRPFIKNLIKIFDLDKNIILKKRISRGRLKKYYQKANVFVCPSLFGESFGIVNLEAMAAGTPVVASRQGGMKEIIKDKKTGFLFRKGDPSDLAEKILLLLKDKDLSAKFSKNALEEVRKNYDWQVVGEKIENIYFDLFLRKK